jgi:hypothetical protein
VEQEWNTLHNVVSFCRHAKEEFESGDQRTRAILARQLGMRYVLSNGVLQIIHHDLLSLVREHKKTALLPNPSLEPEKSGSENGEKGDLSAASQCWGIWLDATRTRIRYASIVFWFEIEVSLHGCTAPCNFGVCRNTREVFIPN